MSARHGKGKSKLARRVTRLEDRHRRDATRLHNEIAQLRVDLTPAPTRSVGVRVPEAIVAAMAEAGPTDEAKWRYDPRCVCGHPRAYHGQTTEPAGPCWVDACAGVVGGCQTFRSAAAGGVPT